MTALDGGLAWAINTWATTNAPDLRREQVESLTRTLTEEGFAKPDTSELNLGDLRKLATKAKTSLTEFIKETSAPAASGPASR